MAGPIFPPGGFRNVHEGDRVQTTQEETEYVIAANHEVSQTHNGNQTKWKDRNQPIEVIPPASV